jgi:cytochrome c biogenesis protein CcmG/thiol:disulfide interchange protein DsbE
MEAEIHVSKTLSAIGLSVALAFALGSIGCAKKVAKAPAKPAPDFSLKDASGKTVHLSDYKGKVVLLDFWATWCGPCKIEIPWFMDFEKQFKDQGFAVVGVSMDEDGWGAINPYVRDMKMNYRVLLGNDDVSTAYGGLDSLPTTLLIGRDGGIASVHVGVSMGKEEFKHAIVQLLDPSSVRGPVVSRGALALLARPGTR